MRIKISLVRNSKFSIKIAYKSALQAVVYSMLDKPFSEWLHNKGFTHEKRSFKLFTFSTFNEKYRFNKELQEFIYPEEVSFNISSPVHEILEQVAKNFVTSTKVDIAGIDFLVSAIEVIQSDEIEPARIRINAKEPIEVHSTLEKGDGSKKTYYYSPREREFSELINENLKKKWYSLHSEKCPHNLKIEPVNVKYCRERVQTFKGTVIKGWTGHFYLEGDEEMLQFALDAGIGSSNSAGYGMIEIVQTDSVETGFKPVSTNLNPNKEEE